MSTEKYIIVHSTLGLDHLSDCVNDEMRKGYVPLGGMIATSFNFGQPSSYAQAMVLQEKVDK